MLPKEWSKRLIDLNVRDLSQKDLDWADYVFLGAMNVQRKSAIEVIAHCKASHKKVVAGGPLFTQEYDHFEEVDYFVLNEAELTLAPFLADLEQGNPKHIYRSDDFADIQATPVPLWDIVDIEKIRFNGNPIFTRLPI